MTEVNEFPHWENTQAIATGTTTAIPFDTRRQLLNFETFYDQSTTITENLENLPEAPNTFRMRFSDWSPFMRSWSRNADDVVTQALPKKRRDFHEFLKDKKVI